MQHPFPGIGILFAIDSLGEGHYGYAAWRVFMRHVSGEELSCCYFVEGDTLSRIGGPAPHFCIGIYGPLDFRMIRERFERLNEPALAAMPSRIVEKPVLDALPLPICGSVDAFGRLVTERWTRMQHELCKETGWSYVPEHVPDDISDTLRAELEYLQLDDFLRGTSRSRRLPTPKELGQPRPVGLVPGLLSASGKWYECPYCGESNYSPYPGPSDSNRRCEECGTVFSRPERQ